MVEEIRPTNVIYGTDSKTQYTCQGNICNNNNITTKELLIID